MKKIIATVLAMVMALALCTTAFATPATPGNTPTLEDQYTKTTDATATTTTDVDVFFAKATEPETNSDDKVTDKGNVAYYTLSTMTGKKYVSVATKGEADIVVYSDAEYKNAVLYLAEMNPDYYVAAVTTNFGKNCGQIVKPAAYDKSNTYYLATGLSNGDKLYVAADNGTESVMVGGKLVSVTLVYADATATVEHSAIPTVDAKTGKVTGYTCSVCKLAAVKAANVASVPSGVQVVAGTDTWYFPAAAASTTTTTSSPKTFDAGIAMYVGMALTSVAGSAVVIGKKKEF